MTCKFYEVDLADKREAEECEAAYLASMSPERREALFRYTNTKKVNDLFD